MFELEYDSCFWSVLQEAAKEVVSTCGKRKRLCVQRTGVHGQHIVQGQRYTVLGVLVQMTDNIDQFTNAARVESNKNKWSGIMV